MLVVLSWSSLSLNSYRLDIPTANPQHKYFCLISYTRNVWTYTSDPLVMAQYVRWLGGDQVQGWLARAGYCTLMELVHMLCLINLGTYSMTIFSLVGVKGMYKLGSGRTNFRDLIT